MSPDDLHIGVDTSSGGGGKNKVHIYLDGVGQGPSGFDNVYVKGENVMKRTKSGHVVDPRTSWGGVGLSRQVGTSAQGDVNPMYSEWEWNEDWNCYMRYNYTTEQWESQ